MLQVNIFSFEFVSHVFSSLVKEEDALVAGTIAYPNMTESHNGGVSIAHDGMPMVIAGSKTLGVQILQKGGSSILPAPPGQEYFWKYSGELPGLHHREGLSAVSFFGTLYAFGGRGPFVERFTCSMYATYYWEKCGQKLRQSRSGHRSIVFIDSIYHIGGRY